ncbi:hypothetical protein TNCV_3083911 [Trichonephila clavipes]|nr:hypothetical protein TNCV_3083911 [Trichonephila clavipes]
MNHRGKWQLWRSVLTIRHSIVEKLGTHMKRKATYSVFQATAQQKFLRLDLRIRQLVRAPILTIPTSRRIVFPHNDDR